MKIKNIFVLYRFNHGEWENNDTLLPLSPCQVTQARTGTMKEATRIKALEIRIPLKIGVENRCLKTALRARSIPRRLPLNSEMWTEVNAKHTF